VLRFWRIVICGSLLLGAVVVCPAYAAEGTPGFSSPAQQARLEARAQEAVTWTTPAAAFSYDEMELVLSLDGGATFPVRVTAFVRPGREGWTWRVPGLPTGHARLALRVGMDERRGFEHILLVSPEFEIVADPNPPLEELFSVDGELRTREALETPPWSGSLRPDADSREQVRPWESPETARETPPSPVLAKRSETGLVLSVAANPSHPRRPTTLRPPSPLTPLRV